MNRDILYERMATEQDSFREWLVNQPPEEILHHAYEYTVREDIVMAMKELELTDAQAQALLDSPTPLADVYRHFEKLETGYMDVIRNSIENRAIDICMNGEMRPSMTEQLERAQLHQSQSQKHQLSTRQMNEEVR